MPLRLPDTCDRCNARLQASIMSVFNTDIICPDCDGKEREHPKYQEAADAEMRAVAAGVRNFPGIGKPADL